MKKYITKFSLVLAILSLSFGGCILDAFDTLTQQIPLSVPITITSDGTSMTNSATVDLDEADAYNQNKDEINRIEFVRIAYRTVSVAPANLSGDITVTLRQVGGAVLFTKRIENAQPVNYINTPYELPVTQQEIQAINTFLASTNNRVFQATVTIDDVAAGTKTLVANIDVIFEMEYDL